MDSDQRSESNTARSGVSYKYDGRALVVSGFPLFITSTDSNTWLIVMHHQWLPAITSGTGKITCSRIVMGDHAHLTRNLAKVY